MVGGRYCFVDFSATANDTGGEPLGRGGRNGTRSIRTQEATEQLLFGFFGIGDFLKILTCSEDAMSTTRTVGEQHQGTDLYDDGWVKS